MAFLRSECQYNESTAGADAGTEAIPLKLYHMLSLYSSLLSLLALVACVVREMMDRDRC